MIHSYITWVLDWLVWTINLLLTLLVCVMFYPMCWVAAASSARRRKLVNTAFRRELRQALVYPKP